MMKKRKFLLICAGIVTIVWILICGLYFARSIYGTGDSGFSAEGNTYLTRSKTSTQVILLSSFVSLLALIAAFILEKKKWLSSLWCKSIISIALWIILANFLAYCLGAAVYEFFLKQ
ncbi:MAG: hypothetical protein A2Y62_10640 [Candidatus Fischerbacteria bacterium RBG_13_37_8]|uniref:Uncharacterized protein n=1 Tax=Candidatus Fischerbacteria bacterium RBG_13_37_8 TaxID=1817863 RepID=A0A1F5VTV2_9BACT|nr:MAG: hypothetical protein A2Y62_10640 [Candidatus Fischerbacteria bacterium RBG_13_37_8]